MDCWGSYSLVWTVTHTQKKSHVEQQDMLITSSERVGDKRNEEIQRRRVWGEEGIKEKSD